MIAVETRYHGPTDTKGARVSARALEDGHPIVWVNHDGSSDGISSHAAALRKYLEKLGWNYGPWFPGDAQRGFVWVCAANDRNAVKYPTREEAQS